MIAFLTVLLPRVLVYPCAADADRSHLRESQDAQAASGNSGAETTTMKSFDKAAREY